MFQSFLKGARLTVGEHGLHVHNGSFDNAGEGCGIIGGHFNPNLVNHGSINSAVRHAGDFGNIEVTIAGEIEVDVKKPGLTINQFLGR